MLDESSREPERGVEHLDGLFREREMVAVTPDFSVCLAGRMP
jgi:hypothetical protein